MKNFEHQLKYNQEQSLPETEQPVEKKSPLREIYPSLSIKGVIGGYKEKISAFLRFKKLKKKGYSDKLTHHEFNELLSFDFKNFIHNVPPMKGVFSAEPELERIKKAPKNEKRELLSIFKENLAKQREALANCRVFIERSIEFNYDVSRENLVGIIESFGKEYGFTDEQKQIAEHIVDGYYENRRKVLDMRERFPDDIALIKELSGVQFSPTDKLDVSVGPMTIDIDTEGFNAGRLWERSDSPIPGFEYGGFASQSSGAEPVYFIVVNQDKEMREKVYHDPTGAMTREHEYEHQKNKLFRAVFEHSLSRQEADNLWLNYENENDIEYKKIFLENYFYAVREDALSRAKDEITACLHDRPFSVLQRDLDWLFCQQKKDPYDYLAYVRDFEGKKDDLLYQELSKKILVEEYKSILEKAVASFGDLMYKGVYTTQEAIALLTDISLSYWPKTVQRLLEYKEK